MVAVCAGISTLIFTWIIGLEDYMFALAFVVGLLSLIPVIGALVSGVLMTLLALTVSPQVALIALTYYIAYQQFESYVTTTPARTSAPPASWMVRGNSPRSNQAHKTAARTSPSATNDANRLPSRRLAAMPLTYANAAVTNPNTKTGCHQATVNPS